MIYLLLPLGLIFLIKGADLLVAGASSVAKKLGVSALVIGLTVVAFGTSMPELIINLIASFKGNTDLAIGNILGSNIANILLILGISAMIFPLMVKRETIWKEIPFSLLAALLVSFMTADALIDGGIFSGLTRIDGLVLLSFFFIFLYYVFSISREEPNQNEGLQVHRHSFIRSLCMILAGLVGLTLGGKWVVDSAVILAFSFGISEAMIGLTIVAIGTSLPELATSVVAAYKKNTDIAVGNVVGSNIFNIFWILGVSAIIRPLPFSPLLIKDVLVTVLATLFLFLFMFVGKRHILERWQGAVFVLFYVLYLSLLIFQEMAK